MLAYLQKIYKRVDDLWTTQYDEYEELQNEMSGMITSAEEGADIVYALDQTIKKMEDLTKHYKRALTMANEITAAVYVQENINNVTSDGLQPIRTDYCTASLKTKTAVGIPSKKKQPEKYAALMEALGVPEKLRGALVPHYMGMMELYTDGLEKGVDHLNGWEPEKEYIVFTFTTRKKQGILTNVKRIND